MEHALAKVRHCDNVFQSLSMRAFILSGGLRQLLSIDSLREQVQTLFHLDETATRVPVARSTWSDALKSRARRDVLRQAVSHLVALARKTLPDKLQGIDGIGHRSVLAMDATYQNESSHFYRVLPEEGGTDNQKKHMHMFYYDIRYGMPLNVKTETASVGEMRVLEKDYCHSTDWGCIRQAIYVVDRAFIKSAYWDAKKAKLKATVITRMKSTLNYSVLALRKVSTHVSNEKVLSDDTIQLDSSKQPWRLIQWVSPEGVHYEYLTNDFDLEPGVVAFLYYRRWDEEKYFDNFKNDLANNKAWGKSTIAIEQQALMGMMAWLLTRLFLHSYFLDTGVEDCTQKRKQMKKVEQYFEVKNLQECFGEACEAEADDNEEDNLLPEYDAYRAFYAQLSKITRQVWRFLKNCFLRKSSPELYERQLKPLIERYL